MEKLLMSSKERKRLEVFSRVKNETMTLVEASEGSCPFCIGVATICRIV